MLNNLCSPLVKELCPIIAIMLLVVSSWSHTVNATLLTLPSLPSEPIPNGVLRGSSSSVHPDSEADLLGPAMSPVNVDLPSPSSGVGGFRALLN